MPDDVDRERNEAEGDEHRRVRVTDKRKSVLEDGPGLEDPQPSVEVATEHVVDELRSELEEARRLAEERLDQLRRQKADFENMRARMVREQTEIVERASQRMVEKLLPVLDDLERALASTVAADDPVARGVELVARKMHEVLREEGVERMEAHGAAFDPHQHEALASEPADVAEPVVLEVVRPGYKLRGRTIRPALVRVATPLPGAEEEGE